MDYCLFVDLSKFKLQSQGLVKVIIALSDSSFLRRVSEGERWREFCFDASSTLELLSASVNSPGPIIRGLRINKFLDFLIQKLLSKFIYFWAYLKKKNTFGPFSKQNGENLK